MRARSSGVPVVAGLLLASLTLPALTHAATVPTAVTKANKSVVRVERFQSDARTAEKSAAFAVDDQGRFLTTLSAVARAPRLKVYIGKRTKPYEAVEVPNDAPPGLTLIRIVGSAPDLTPLTPANGLPGDSKYWISAAPARKSARDALTRPLETQIIPPLESCSQGAGIKTVDATARPRTNGSPVLNRLGHFVGVVRANPPADSRGRGQCKFLQFLPATRVPAHLANVPAPARSDFPAVTVVIVLAIVLVLANLFFLLRRRNALAEPVLVKPSDTPTGEPAPEAPVYEVEDDLEITIRPREGSMTRVSPAANTTRVSRSPAAPTRVSEPPDAPPPDPDDELGPISLK